MKRPEAVPRTLPAALGFSAEQLAQLHDRAAMEDWLRLNQRDLERLARRDPTAALENPFPGGVRPKRRPNRDPYSLDDLFGSAE